MEVSVGFTDEEANHFPKEEYVQEESELGRVYYPTGLDVDEEIWINYEEKPWMSYFLVTGLHIKKK